MNNMYSSEQFEKQYTYTGCDLGANWTPEQTMFRVWAPTAQAVWVNLYQGGTPNTNDRLEQLPMTKAENGTWVAEKSGDLNGVYYTYVVQVNDKLREACDPYARTTGVNGHRAMVIDLDATNPEGWATDKDPHGGKPITDAVIYELHIRDLSIDPDSGIKHKGKYLGLTETGTTNAKGMPTGLDHIKSMGITHLHLLPIYDYGSVDEAHPEQPQFNWGYDPVNYNVPEGSYATDPFQGQVRVKELKQMIHALHQNGISVVMDVVYNHVYKTEEFCFNQIVPGYFSRGGSNGSGCGNDTASERSMVRKYIVDSVCYWADEYHIDGFRFDLVGLIDTETINQIIQAVHAKHPNVIFYGEGWSMYSAVTKRNTILTCQANAPRTPKFAFFCDTMRDAIKGSVFRGEDPGYVSGNGDLAYAIHRCFMGLPGWTNRPGQIVNYASCHDNLSLFDKLTLATPGQSQQKRIRMNNLAAAIYMTSQGIPLFQAGEEMLRSKPLGNGKFEHNSYNSPDAINSIKWGVLGNEEYDRVVEYYRGLIAFRKAHPALRMSNPAEVTKHMIPMAEPGSALAFHITAGAGGQMQDTVVIFNPGHADLTTALPKGNWTCYVDHEHAGNQPLFTAEKQVTVAPISAMVLVKE